MQINPTKYFIAANPTSEGWKCEACGNCPIVPDNRTQFPYIHCTDCVDLDHKLHNEKYGCIENGPHSC